ncbi:hypothetical protein BDZ97DRAFT_1918704 [Flammula alnicola]|nr:hypothetical protein BDZ97DRAFT_1918704 [Flammula alnicola]
MSGNPRLDVAHLTSLFLESLFNGIFWVLFYECNSVLWQRHKVRQERLFTPIFVVAWILFCTVTVHCVIELTEAFNAFIRPRDVGYVVQPHGLTPAEIFYMQLYRPMNVIYSSFYVATAVIADGFLIYRLYMVWGRNKLIIIAPLLVCIALLVCGSIVIYYYKNYKQSVFGISRQWILASFAMTFIGNVYSTALIAYRIASAQHHPRARHAPKTKLERVVEILVQSCALYCFLVCLSLIFMSIQSNLAYCTVAVSNPAIGIIFCMIINRTHHDESYAVYGEQLEIVDSTHQPSSLQVPMTFETVSEFKPNPNVSNAGAVESCGSPDNLNGSSSGREDSSSIREVPNKV